MIHVFPLYGRIATLIYEATTLDEIKLLHDTFPAVPMCRCKGTFLSYVPSVWVDEHPEKYEHDNVYEIMPYIIKVENTHVPEVTIKWFTNLGDMKIEIDIRWKINPKCNDYWNIETRRSGHTKKSKIIHTYIYFEDEFNLVYPNSNEEITPQYNKWAKDPKSTFPSDMTIYSDCYDLGLLDFKFFKPLINGGKDD